MTVCSLHGHAQAAEKRELTPLTVTLPLNREAAGNVAQAKQWIEQERFDEAMVSLSEARLATDAMTPMGPDRYVPLASAVHQLEAQLPESVQALRRLVNRRDGVAERSDLPVAAEATSAANTREWTSTVSDAQWGEVWVGAWRLSWGENDLILPQSSRSSQKQQQALTTDAQWLKSGYPMTRGTLVDDTLVVGTSSTLLRWDAASGEKDISFPSDDYYARTTWRHFAQVGGIRIQLARASSNVMWHFSEQLGKSVLHAGALLYRVERNLPAELSAGKFKSGKEKIKQGKYRSAITKRFGHGWITNRFCAYRVSSGQRVFELASPDDIDHEDFGMRFISEPVLTDGGVLIVVHNGQGVSVRHYNASGVEQFQIPLGEVFPGTLQRHMPCALLVNGDQAYVMPGVGALYKVGLHDRRVSEVVRYPHYPVPQQNALNVKSMSDASVMMSHGFHYHDGRLLCLPTDSDVMMAVDVRTPSMQLMWHKSRQGTQALYPLGKYVVTTDKRMVRVLSLVSGKSVSQYDGARITGLGVGLDQQRLLIPSTKGLIRCELNKQGIAQFRVSVVARQNGGSESPFIGNLVAHKGQVLAVGPGWVESLMPQSAMQSQWEKAWASNPGLALLNKKGLMALNLTQQQHASVALAAFKRVDGELSQPTNEAWVNTYLTTLIRRKQAEVAGDTTQAQALKQAGYLFRHEIKLHIARLSHATPASTPEAP